VVLGHLCIGSAGAAVPNVPGFQGALARLFERDSTHTHHSPRRHVVALQCCADYSASREDFPTRYLGFSQPSQFTGGRIHFGFWCCRNDRDCGRDADFLSGVYAGSTKLASNFYAAGRSSPTRQTSRRAAMLDLVYLLLGLGVFGLMGLYARWAANA
jgi:hypothetical protein